MSDFSLDSSQEAAQLLAGMLPYLKRYQGRLFVIKYGGNAMTDPTLQQSFAKDIVLLQTLGIKVVVVHGGGPQIEAALSRVNVQSRFTAGLRVTDADAMRVVQWVLAGQVQQEIVGMIQSQGGRAIGLCGFDGGMITAKKTTVPDPDHPGQSLDIGQVGEVVEVCTEPLFTLLNAGYTPVVSPICRDVHQQSYNVNADAVAAAIAQATQAEKLFLLTNITGVLDKSGHLIRELNPEKVNGYIKDGTVSGGMLPKIAGALDAAQSGVGCVHIIDGRVPHSLLLEILAGKAYGTIVHP